MSQPLTHQVIMRAREIIADRAHWTQRYALFKNGQMADPHDPRAWRFCATGAMIKAGFELTGDINRAHALREAACGNLCLLINNPVQGVETINDSRGGHAKVLKLFDDYLADARC